MKKLHWNVIFLAINGIIFRISEYIDVCVCVYLGDFLSYSKIGNLLRDKSKILIRIATINGVLSVSRFLLCCLCVPLAII